MVSHMVSAHTHCQQLLASLCLGLLCWSTAGVSAAAFGSTSIAVQPVSTSDLASKCDGDSSRRARSIFTEVRSPHHRWMFTGFLSAWQQSLGSLHAWAELQGVPHRADARQEDHRSTQLATASAESRASKAGVVDA